MTHTFEPATPSRDANALLALTVVLILTTWSFFGRFSVVAAAAGVATGVWLHWWYRRHPASLARNGADRRPPMLNISAVYVGGDAAGLAFVVGCVVIFTMGLPPLRWFVVASALLAVAFAATVIGWHRTHPIWSDSRALLGR
ncbi:MAG: hypothetical protein ACRD3G_20425 [Vicinamibacterales bacterium]